MSRRALALAVLLSLLAGLQPYLLSGIDPLHALPATRDGTDPLLQSALLQHTLRHAPFAESLWHAPIFWPTPWATATMEPLLGQSLPIRWVGALRRAPALAYNLCLMLTLAGAFLATVALGRRAGLAAGASMLAAAAFVASPWASTHLHHLNQLPTPWLPLALWALWGLAEGRRGSALVLALALLLQIGCGVYGTASILVLLGVALLALPHRPSRRGWLELGGVLLVLLVGLWLWSRPYAAASAALEGYGRGGAGVQAFAARLPDLLHPPQRHLLPWPPPDPSRPMVYPGWGMAMLAAWGGVVAWRAGGSARRRACALAGAGALGLLLAFGRSLPLPGGTEIPLPYAFLQDHLWPVGALRAVTRFFQLTTLAVALLGVAGAGDLLRRSRPWGLLALGIALLEFAPAGGGQVRGDLDRSEGVILERLEALPRPTPWAALPMPCREADEGPAEARAMLLACMAQQPLVGGVSGFVPAPIARIRRACCELPAEGCAVVLREAGVRWVLREGALIPLMGAAAAD